MPDQSQIGLLAKAVIGLQLPLRVLHSQAGAYIGTSNEEGPISRESEEYWFDPNHAQPVMIPRLAPEHESGAGMVDK